MFLNVPEALYRLWGWSCSGRVVKCGKWYLLSPLEFTAKPARYCLYSVITGSTKGYESWSAAKIELQRTARSPSVHPSEPRGLRDVVGEKAAFRIPCMFQIILTNVVFQ